MGKCSGEHVAPGLQCHLHTEHCIKIVKESCYRATTPIIGCTNRFRNAQWDFSTNQTITNHERFQSSHIISHMLHQASGPSLSLNWETTLTNNGRTHPFVCCPHHCWCSLWRERQGIVAWVRIFVDYALFCLETSLGHCFLKQCIAFDHKWLCFT